MRIHNLTLAMWTWLSQEHGRALLFDVVEQGNRFGIFRDGSFKALSNFKIDISSEVKDGGLLSGYTCTVTLLDGTDLG